MTISAVLAPIAISRIDNPDLLPAVLIFLVGAAVTIVSAALCLNPKRFRRVNPDDRFLLHFSYISRQKRSEYLTQMAEVMEDTTLLSHEVAKDLYHLSHDVLIPKFRWLRIAYASFVLSLCLAIAVVVITYLR